MSHFRRLSSPLLVINIAYIYIFLIGLILYGEGFYENSTFFNWGPPIKFFGHDITSERTFYALHVLIFFHQLINNWVNSVVYPWILNSVQDPKNRNMEYSRWTSLLIINEFNTYSEFDLVFILIGFTSQISFVATINLANMITSTIINNRYILEKMREEPLIENNEMYTAINVV
uniref:Uncharacterized protein n=1 Tax=viral metagenome TaxID=1070528 RepID=A0A6C0EKL1_9ZZZZ